MVVVKWSVCLLSISTIRVRILLTTTVFSVKFVFEKNENKQIEALGAHLIKKIEGPQEVPNLHSFTIHGITGSRDY